MNRDPSALPAPLRGLLRRLPEAPHAAGAAVALNAALAAGMLRREDFDCLVERCVRLEASDLGTGMNLTLRRNRFCATTASPHVTIRARLSDFARLALRREDPDTLFFNRRLTIEGDTELGLAIKNALDAIDWDRLPAPLRSLLRLATARSVE